MASISPVVITCAAGNQCSVLIPYLYGSYPLRLVVQSDGSVSKLRSKYLQAEVVKADLAQPNDCARILEGASAVYHVGPSIHPHEKEVGLNMVDAAVQECEKPSSKFKHFIFSSVLNTQLRKMFNHDDKRYIEEYLIESGLNFTILNPGDFVEISFTVKAWVQSNEYIWRAWLPPTTKSSLVFLKDLAEAAAKVIKEGPAHYQAQYPIVSLGCIAYGDVASRIAEIMGKPLETQRIDPESAVEGLLGWCFPHGKPPDRSRDKAERLILFYSRRGLQGNSSVLEWLLGRKPTTLEEYITEQTAAANDKQ